MSYDLIVFDSNYAPHEKEAFMTWYLHQVEWTEDHSYENPAVSTEPLRNWFMEMIETFPQMNGPYAPTEDAWSSLTKEEESNVTDYAIGTKMIYAAFAWSVAEQALRCVRNLAKKYGVGFFDVSASDGEIIFPEE